MVHMINSEPSAQFKLFWNEIIQELIFNILEKNDCLCIKSPNIRTEILVEFENYKEQTRKYMVGNRLDRHKLAACICGAIIKVQPLAKISRYAGIDNSFPNLNEKLATYVAFNVLKMFMVQDLEDKIHPDKRIIFKKSFKIRVPSVNENSKDLKSYKENFYNALARTYYKCERSNKICYTFDVWAYAKIFYHLELYNLPYLKEAFDNFN